MQFPSLRKIERILIVLGIMCLAVYAGARLHSIIGAQIALSRADASSGPAASVNFRSTGSELPRDSADYSLWSEKRIAAYKQTLLMQFDPPLAVLRIPRLNLQVPIFDGTNELILNRGAGRIEGTAMPGSDGNIGIAAHRDGFFRSLKDISVGDTLQLATSSGTISYAIDNIEIVTPDNVTVLQRRPHPSVTLVTCYPFYFVGDAPQRYIVHAALVRDDRRTEPAAAAAEQAQATEGDGAIAAVAKK